MKFFNLGSSCLIAFLVCDSFAMVGGVNPQQQMMQQQMMQQQMMQQQMMAQQQAAMAAAQQQAMAQQAAAGGAEGAEGEQEAPVYQAQPGTVTQQGAGEQTSEVDEDTIGTKDTNADGNPFNDDYPKYGKDVFKDNATFFFKDGGSLKKRTMPVADLKKSIIIFFGDWCSSCQAFISSFAKTIDFLTMYGVEVIFAHVPSSSVLQNWQDPTIEDYNAAESRLNSYGVTLSKNVKMVWIGGRHVISSANIESLPIVIAVKNSKEYYRGIGADAIQHINVDNTENLKNFLTLWNEDRKPKETSASSKAKRTSHSKYNKSARRFKKPDVRTATLWTDNLNQPKSKKLYER